MTDDIRVLVVDDDPTARKGLVRYLRTVAEFEVTECENGPDALGHLESSADDYAAVLLDYMLTPELNGKEVLNTILERYSELPVIVFTGKNPRGGLETLAEGAYRYMSRPINYIELVNAVRSAAEQDLIFRQMAHDVRNMLGSDVCLAWRLDRKNRRFRVAGWDGKLDEWYRKNVFLDPDDISTKELFAIGNPLFLADVTDSEQAPQYRHPEIAEDRNWTSLVSIPLVRQDHVVGLIDSYTYEQYTFPGGDDVRWIEHILPSFSRQAAEAVRNAEFTDQLQTLQNINQVLAGTFDEDTVIRQILGKGLELVGADFGWLYLLSPDGEKLVARDWLGIPDDRIEPERELGVGITGWVAQEGQALRVADVSNDSRHVSTPDVEVKSEAAVPLRREEQTIGVLTAKSSAHNAFTTDDIDLLMSLASQAVVVLERTGLTEHLQEVSQLALVGEFEQLAAYVVKAVGNLAGAEVILWLMSDREGEVGHRLRIAASQGDFDESYCEKAWVPLKPGSSITAKALDVGKSIIRANVLEDSEDLVFHNLREARRRDWRSFMAAPLLGGEGKHLGSLSLYAEEIGKFSESEGELIQAFANQAAIALEQVQQREQLVRAIEEISKLIVTTLPQGEVLDRILDWTLALLAEASLGEIRLLEKGKESDELVVKSARGEVINEVYSRMPVGEGITGWVAKHEKLLLVSDVSEDERYVAFLEGTGSEIAVPMIADEELIGVLNIEHPETEAFSETDLKLAGAIANLTAVAIDNARLYQERDQRVEELEILTEIGRTVSSMGIEEILEMIYREAGKLMDVRNIQIAFYDEETDMVSFPFACVDGEQVEVGVGMFSPRKRGRDRYGLTEYVIDRGAAVSEGDIWEWAEERGIELSSSLDTQSWIGAPLKVGERVIGLISIQSLEQEGAYDENHLRVLETIASQAAVAIENARLYENLEDKIEQLKSAQERIAETESVITRMSIAADFVHRVNNLAGTIPFWVDEARAYLSKDPVNRESLAHALDRIDLDVDGLLRAAEQLNSPLEPKKVNVAEKLNSLARQALVQAPANIKVEVDCASEDLFVKAVDKEIAYAFWSIIENSIVAMPEGGVLTVRARKAIDIVAAEERVRVQIEDEGVGIAESEKERIFEPFYSTRERHLGYGLWRAKNIFEKVGGSIVFESEEGVGTKFVIDLPMATEGEKNV